MAKKQVPIYSVAEITALIKSVLAGGLPGRLAISGEISGWKVYGSGHGYFTLKDDNGVMPCVMWKSHLSKLKFEPDNGAAVVATGYIDVYEPSGKYQFYAETMEPEGVGALQLAFEQLVKKLSAEGLFDEVHKRPLPRFPMRIGIVTSGSGAAVHDIADSVHNRWPCAKMYLYPVLVQGDGAAKDIAAAINNINKANRKLKLDILIVGRGGGSLEDLWAFNEEVVARAIFASKIPIISAVGHEVDTTIADFVADVRASTPTKAGVVAVPDIREVFERLELLQHRLNNNLTKRCQYYDQQLKTVIASAVFRNTESIIAKATQRLDELARDTANGAKGLLADLRVQIETQSSQIQKIEPRRLISNKRLDLAELDSRSKAAIVSTVSKNKLKFSQIDGILRGLDPKSVLNRGYSITVNSRTGNVVTKAADVAAGDEIVTEMAEKQTITSKVIKN